MGEPMPSVVPAANRYRVLALEPDERLRTRMTLELAGIASAPFSTFDELLADLSDGKPTVVMFGASLANETGLEAARRIGRANPETGVVLLAEELNISLLQ